MKYITRSYGKRKKKENWMLYFIFLFSADFNHIVEIKFKSWDYLLLSNFPNSTAAKGWKLETKLEQDIHGNLTR